MGHKNTVAIVMGPTGSGKSALGLAVAARRPAVIINADASQLVAELRLLTARPSVAEEAQAEHALYGVVPAMQPTSVALWLSLVVSEIRRAWAAGKLPVVLGGTGMYIRALQQGLATIPPIPETVRAPLRALDAAHVRAQLEARDPDMASRLKPGDSQRNLRALEVLEATGQSLALWQAQGNMLPLPEAAFSEFYIDVAKPVLYPRLDARFNTMLEAGALDEVRSFMDLNIPAENPITRACGVPELMAHLRGELGLAEAVALAQQSTRNYAKRQQTWIRNQMKTATPVANAADMLGHLPA